MEMACFEDEKLMMNAFRKVLFFFGIICASVKADTVVEDNHPNIIFIMIDDMGWKDLKCYGGDIFDTPNIDRLAVEGMRFTDAYAACSVCSPTRVSLMTGKYPGRLHFTALNHHRKFAGDVEKNPTGIKLIQPEISDEDGLQDDEYPLPRAFRDAGYRTAMFGKTHFGNGDEDLSAMGFDVHADPACYIKVDPPVIVDHDPGRMTTITDLSINFINDCRKDNVPFFLYVSHHAVHVQIEATQKYFEKYDRLMSEEQKQIYSPYYVAMVAELDHEIGRLLDRLDELGLENNTAVIFTSDNGGVDTMPAKKPYKLTSMEPLRGQKGGQYEGSHRVPLIVKWPGGIVPGSVSEEVVITPDYYPTCLQIAGLPLHEEQHVDGISIVPALTGKTLGREAVYWHKPHYYSQSPISAVRCGRYKYILYWENELSPFGGHEAELFDLESDIGERHNIASEKPEVAQRLKSMLMGHLKESNCEIPKVNPQYCDPQQYTLGKWVKADDFEEYDLNTEIVGKNGWQPAKDTLSFSAMAVSNPSGSGKVLQFRKTDFTQGNACLVQAGSGLFCKTQKSPQTVFVRFMFSDCEQLKGMAEEFSGFGVAAAVNGVCGFKQGFLVADTDNNNSARELANPVGIMADSLMPDMWYNCWVVVDNQHPDSARLFLQSDDDERFGTQTEISVQGTWIAAQGESPYRIFVLSANHSSGPVLYVDDMYFDNTSKNLLPVK